MFGEEIVLVSHRFEELIHMGAHPLLVLLLLKPLVLTKFLTGNLIAPALSFTPVPFSQQLKGCRVQLI